MSMCDTTKLFLKCIFSFLKGEQNLAAKLVVTCIFNTEQQADEMFLKQETNLT